MLALSTLLISSHAGTSFISLALRFDKRARRGAWCAECTLSPRRPGSQALSRWWSPAAGSTEKGAVCGYVRVKENTSIDVLRPSGEPHGARLPWSPLGRAPDAARGRRSSYRCWAVPTKGVGMDETELEKLARLSGNHRARMHDQPSRSRRNPIALSSELRSSETCAHRSGAFRSFRADHFLAEA
jgi:hypothetical protein